jgi:hypothetical protein
MKKHFFFIILLSIAIFSTVTSFYIELSFMLGIVLLMILINKIGKGIVLRETIAFMYSFFCLIMPAIGYMYYPRSNHLSRLWVRYMPVPEDVYFSFALPAIAFFSLALLLPISKESITDEGEGLRVLFEKMKKVLDANKKLGLVIISIGTGISFTIPYLPGGLQFFATLVYFSSFSGFLYLYFTKGIRYKKWVIILFVLFVLFNAINGGMFTIVAYMGITIFSFLLSGKKTFLVTKLSIFLVATFLILALQNVKGVYRDFTWRQNYKGNKITLFSDLYWKQLVKGTDIIDPTAMFGFYTRGNQGYNVALVMQRVPTMQPYDNGSRLMTVFASAFVPRFLWPDKPEAGGKFNMKYYAGWNIAGWSTNVGPLGEAYGSFGSTGGIIYMFLLGLFLRWVYLKMFKLSNVTPLLICWLPVIFYQVTSSAETDTLSILNPVIKASFFLFLIYKILPGWFGKGKAANQKNVSVPIQSPQPV